VSAQKEKLIEERLLVTLRSNPQVLKIENSTSDAANVADLLCCREEPEVVHDNSDWNPHPKLMQDLIGNMIPDIVLRSRASRENRVYIEVKDSEPLRYRAEDSQVVRYFLHLLATTRKTPVKGQADIRRAILLCAPSVWFERDANAKKWNHFREYFLGLSKAFDITLGELHADSF